MFIGTYFALSNPSFFGAEEISELTFGTALYVVRNLAVGFALLLAIFLRNAHMLFILIFIRLITDLFDAPLFILFTDSDPLRLLTIFISICYLPAIISLRYLWKQM